MMDNVIVDTSLYDKMEQNALVSVASQASASKGSELEKI